jgi:hypothetical protein
VPLIEPAHDERVLLGTITPQGFEVSYSLCFFTFLLLAASSEPRDTTDRV